jgi:hypothetical protein
MRLPRYVLLIFLSALSCALQGQDLLNAFGKALQKEGGKKGAIQKTSLDSVDFQFAISVNENASFFDVEQKGETGSKLLYALKDEADKTLVEKARDSLELGVGYYEAKWYKLAEVQFVATKAFMEGNALTNEIVYLRTLSNLG